MGYMIKNGVAYAGANSIQLTQAQYDAIVQAGTLDPNALYFITDAQGSLIKRNLTQAEYDALSTAEKNNGTVYFISDSDNMLPAGSVSYDPSVSGLSATDVKSAIDEVADELGTIDETLNKFGFNKIKTQTFTGLTVPANYIDTRDLTLTVPADYGILCGFSLASTSNCSVIQCYFNNTTTLHTRVLNLANQQDTYSFVVFYI